ncbi:MAG: hypothetical protein FWC42_07120 [Proteobacteria bacterium]|nr:hypothetical protein [Pseudomonadota bacterium]
MKTIFILSLLALMSTGCASLQSAQNVTAANANEVRHVRFAERVVLFEQGREKSGVCPGPDVEFAIDAMGAGHGDATAETLVNMLGLKLDGAASESLSCQLFIHRNAAFSRLKRAQSRTIVEHYRNVNERHRRTEDEVRKELGSWIESFESNSDQEGDEECYYQASGDQSLIPTQDLATAVAMANEVKLVRFAEGLIMAEAIKSQISSIQEARKRELCPEPWATELAVSTIGVGKSETAANALLNLLGTRLSDTVSEELTCQILARGQAFINRLEQAQPKTIAQNCRLSFYQVRNTDEVKAEQVCRTEDEINGLRGKMIGAIRSKASCALQ